MSNINKIKIVNKIDRFGSEEKNPNSINLLAIDSQLDLPSLFKVFGNEKLLDNLWKKHQRTPEQLLLQALNSNTSKVENPLSKTAYGIKNDETGYTVFWIPKDGFSDLSKNNTVIDPYLVFNNGQAEYFLNQSDYSNEGNIPASDVYFPSKLDQNYYCLKISNQYVPGNNLTIKTLNGANKIGVSIFKSYQEFLVYHFTNVTLSEYYVFNDKYSDAIFYIADPQDSEMIRTFADIYDDEKVLLPYIVVDQTFEQYYNWYDKKWEKFSDIQTEDNRYFQDNLKQQKQEFLNNLPKNITKRLEEIGFNIDLSRTQAEMIPTYKDEGRKYEKYIIDYRGSDFVSDSGLLAAIIIVPNNVNLGLDGLTNPIIYVDNDDIETYFNEHASNRTDATTIIFNKSFTKMIIGRGSYSYKLDITNNNKYSNSDLYNLIEVVQNYLSRA